MKPGCLAVTDTIQLHVMETISSKLNQLKYRPETSINISTIIPDFDQHHIKIIEATPPTTNNDWHHSRTALSLSQIEQQVKNLRNERTHSHSHIMGGTKGIAALLAFIAYIIWRKLRKNRPTIIEVQAQQEPGTTSPCKHPPTLFAMPTESTQTECNEGHRTIAVQTGHQGHWIQEGNGPRHRDLARPMQHHPPGIREKEPQSTSGRMASSWRSSLTITYGGGCPANPTNARGLEGMRDRFLSI
ncbi:hypothetical protein WH47_01973 [Habropoda laboriosa]|uniref:Uncharacterized protein n=1 Tax=Habropoda laboriosa TaxID=597456 RepID=A0A0L7R0E2_9HYME|nr:hypothetical protein WH47_01973 [Habropoda laboriosa]